MLEWAWSFRACPTRPHPSRPAGTQVVRPTKEQIAKGVMIPHLFENPKRREDPVIKALLEQASPGRPVTR